MEELKFGKREKKRRETETSRVKGSIDLRFPILPHGGKLTVMYSSKRKVRLEKYPVIKITRREWCDLQLLGIGKR